MNQPVWIWYPGDMELYHGMKQNFEREERGYDWPAFWKMDDWRKNIRFFRTYILEEPETFEVHAFGVGHVVVNQAKYPLEQKIVLSPGVNKIQVFVGSRTGLPAVYIESEGGTVQSDGTWMADDFTRMHPVGTSSLFTKKEQDPNEVPYAEEEFSPVSVTAAHGGTLADFGRMVNGHPKIFFTDKKNSGNPSFTIAYGESAEEATDLKWCYYKETGLVRDDFREGTEQPKLRRRAFRYIFLPGVDAEELNISAVHTKIPLEVKAECPVKDPQLKKIWDICRETYLLCGGLFFIDGIKRDRWIWGGDACQSFAVNPYLLRDPEIDKRTLRTLFGNLPVRQHINTIVDYSLLALIALENEHRMFPDCSFLREMYPKAEAMTQLLLSQKNEDGFLIPRERDWIYVDWADIDKNGAISAEQILLWRALKAMAYCARTLAEDKGLHAESETIREGHCIKKVLLHGPDGRPLPEDILMEKMVPVSDEEREVLLRAAKSYESTAEMLKERIDAFFWDPEKGAYIDCYESGKRHVSRHANIFAVLYDFADRAKAEEIISHVLENPEIPAITTPYFKFYELDVFGKLGMKKRLEEEIRSYWGGMIERGAVTIWEEFDPQVEGAGQYAMYGDPFGKSLCHAWGASPIYLIGKYLA